MTGPADTKIVNVVIVGTAGQGVITLKRLIEFIAAEEGFEGVFGSEMHGLAQREGAIASHCRLQRKLSPNGRENIFSSTICYGEADLIIGFEPVEVLRNAGLFASERTVFVINNRDIPPIMVTAGKEKYPSIKEIGGYLEAYKQAPGNVHFLNATELALRGLGDAQKMNLVMFGFSLATGLLDFSMDSCESVITRELRDAKANINALHLGLQRGHDLLRS